jgi:hypothetical protein
MNVIKFTVGKIENRDTSHFSKSLRFDKRRESQKWDVSLFSKIPLQSPPGHYLQSPWSIRLPSHDKDRDFCVLVNDTKCDTA